MAVGRRGAARRSDLGAARPASAGQARLPSSRRAPAGAVALGAALALAACGGVGSPGTPTGGRGDVLVIVTVTPGPPPPAPVRGETDPYVVQEGDTLSDLAARFGVSEDALREANGIDDPDSLFVGQELRVPTPQP